MKIKVSNENLVDGNSIHHQMILHRFRKVALRHTDDIEKTFKEGKDDPFSKWAIIQSEFDQALRVHGITTQIEFE